MQSKVTITSIAAATAITLTGLMVACSGDDPPTPQPTSTPTVSSVTLTPSSVTVPATASGRVTLSGAAPSSGATVTLRSSDTSQATVPGSVTVPNGGTTADFTVTAVAAGSPRIEASFNNTTQGATLTISAATGPGPTVNLASLTLSSSSIVGGNAVDGSVTLSAAAPAGGATVTLTSSDQGVAAVPSSVTVAAGATTATFSITTRAVGGTFLITITGSFGGQTRTANLAVDPLAAPPLAAVFSVVAKSSGALNSCSMSVGGGSLECTFDGRASTGSNLSQYLWTYTLPGQQLSASGALVDTPAAGCGFFSGVTTKNSGNPFQMIVTLRVVDGSGNSSAPVTNQNVMVTPLNNTCGFSF